MAVVAPAAPAREPGLITRLLIWVSGVDKTTLNESPAEDWDCVRSIGLLMIFAWMYQAALITIVAHRVFAPDGAFQPGLALGAGFIATLMLLIDSYVFVRAGFHADGIRELARAGLDLSGGWAVKLTAGIFLGFRILLALGFAQLTAIFVALLLYQNDIATDLNSRAQHQNTALIAAANRHVDADIKQASDAVKETQQRVEALRNERDVTLRYLRSRGTWRNAARANQAQAALPELEQDLRAATSDLGTLRQDLAERINGRDAAIQKEVANSPEHVEPATGVLAQLNAMRRIAANSIMVAIVIGLIDLTSFGLELAAVLAKQTTFIPTTYAVLLVRNNYLRVASIVDELEERINRRDRTDGDPFGPPDPPGPGGGGRSNVTWFPGAGGPGKPPTGKRPRGRPRKNRPDDESPTPVA